MLWGAHSLWTLLVQGTYCTLFRHAFSQLVSLQAQPGLPKATKLHIAAGCLAHEMHL